MMSIKLLKSVVTVLAALSLTVPSIAAPVTYDQTYGGVVSAPLETAGNVAVVYDGWGYQPRNLDRAQTGVSWQFEYAPGNRRALRSHFDGTNTVHSFELANGRAKFDSNGRKRFHVSDKLYLVEQDGSVTHYVPILNRKGSSVGLTSTDQTPLIRFDYSTLGSTAPNSNTNNCTTFRCEDDLNAYNQLWEGLGNFDMGNGDAIIDNRHRLYSASFGRFWHRDRAHQSPSPYASRGGDSLNMNDANGDEFFRAIYDRLTSAKGIVALLALSTGAAYYEYYRSDYHSALENSTISTIVDSVPRIETFVSEQWIPPEYGGYSGNVSYGEDIPVNYVNDVFSYSGFPENDGYRTWGGFALFNEDGPYDIRSLRTNMHTYPLSLNESRRQRQVDNHIQNMEKPTALLEQYSILSTVYHGGQKDRANFNSEDGGVLIANFHLSQRKDFVDQESKGIGEIGEALTKRFGGMTFVSPNKAQAIVSWDRKGWDDARKSVTEFQKQFSDRINKVDYSSPKGGIDWGQGGSGKKLTDKRRDEIKTDYHHRPVMPE